FQMTMRVHPSGYLLGDTELGLEAPVDHKIRAGAESGTIRHQERDQLGDLLRLADAPEWMRRAEAPKRLLEIGSRTIKGSCGHPQHRRAHRSGRHRVHADSISRAIQGQTACESVHRPLAGRVGADSLLTGIALHA